MFWKGKRVFVTGHTGFKGAWMSLWLKQLGAEVKGYALAPPTTPSLFIEADIAGDIESVIGDIGDQERLREELCAFRPDIVFHLAAQALVRESYADPVGTYRTNVMGTVHLLEAVRACPYVAAVVGITTDKCYENREWVWPYRENDALGGWDPYSSSKACAELVIAAYQKSFFLTKGSNATPVGLASARAGNVIGGGDWAADRLIADMFRAFSAGEAVRLRNPDAIRPWQHVLEPLRGYLVLAERLYTERATFSSAWNFGPNSSDAKPVRWVADFFIERWGTESRWIDDSGEQVHEAQVLKLDCSKAASSLGWQPLLELREALDMTVSWYRRYLEGTPARAITLEQISEYSSRAGIGNSTSVGH
jgi:CDP-glucose 4,6-dehydratase